MSSATHLYVASADHMTSPHPHLSDSIPSTPEALVSPLSVLPNRKPCLEHMHKVGHSSPPADADAGLTSRETERPVCRVLTHRPSSLRLSCHFGPGRQAHVLSAQDQECRSQSLNSPGTPEETIGEGCGYRLSHTGEAPAS